jgi:hypothetical protein|tara:strand:- start:1362 stop:1559 length:198 start_codon:yes stop_codon:yes gene_type:complete
MKTVIINSVRKNTIINNIILISFSTILCSLFCFAILQIAEDREVKRIDLQEKAWKQKGYNLNNTK